ncbi:MAG: hypothetical protein IJO47_08985, partial [Clostridia bacterium]|nr:hypothetical protein [Clostridia bacterium]
MKKGAIYVLMCYILWGVLPIFWKQLGGIDSFYILSLRIVWSLIFCGLILAAKGELHKIKEALSDKKERNMLLLSSIMGVYVLISNGLLVLLDAEKGSSEEMLSVPMQQIARVYCAHGEAA